MSFEIQHDHVDILDIPQIINFQYTRPPNMLFAQLEPPMFFWMFCVDGLPFLRSELDVHGRMKLQAGCILITLKRVFSSETIHVLGSKLPLFRYNRGWSSTE